MTSDGSLSKQGSAPSQPGPDCCSSETKLILKNFVVKGYHVYKIRPPYTNPATLLTIDREYTNKHDAHACIVWLPPLDSFPKEKHDMLTDAKRQLRLSDIAGLPIGHVPKSLSSDFRSIIDAGGEIHAEVTGHPIPSFSPWPEKSEEGGGVVLPCQYIINKVDVNVYYEKLSQTLKSIKEGAAMQLEKA